MKRTGGDWTVVDGTNVVAGDRLVANTGGYTNSVRPTATRLENIANAQAIAALPKVVGAVKDALDDADNSWLTLAGRLEQIKAGLGKALKELEGDDG